MGSSLTEDPSWPEDPSWAAAREYLEVRDPAFIEGVLCRQAADRKSALNVQVSGDHYKSHAIQPIEYIHANGIPFAEGCVIKYVSRWRSKGGLKDLEKAKHFIDLLIELETAKVAQSQRQA